MRRNEVRFATRHRLRCAAFFVCILYFLKGWVSIWSFLITEHRSTGSTRSFCVCLPSGCRRLRGSRRIKIARPAGSGRRAGARKLAQIVKAAPEELQEEAVSLYRLLFSLSRSYQRDLLDEKRRFRRFSKRRWNRRRSSSRPQQPLPAKALRARIRSRPATSCSSIRAYSSARHLTRSSPLSSRACASTAFCRWKTARQARSTRCMTSCRSTISPSSAASACA